MSEFDRLVDRIEQLVIDDQELQKYAHRVALERAYGGDAARFDHDQEHDSSNRRQQLYWATTSGVIQSLLGRIIDKMHHWEGK